MVIPRRHTEHLLSCDAETLSHVMDTVKKASDHLVENCGYEGVNVFTAQAARPSRA